MQPILDAQTTESLIFELISRIAHHMIFVVGDFTWFEQKYVAMLHAKYKQAHSVKELIVVHNLRNTGRVSEAKELFARHVTQCYEGATSHLGELFFTADHGSSTPVHHIGICDAKSLAGLHFNQPNFDTLMKMLELKNMMCAPITLSQLLCQEMQRLLPTFVKTECPEEQAEASEALGYRRVAVMHLRCPSPGCHISVKTHGVISELGEIVTHDTSFNPIYNVFDQMRDGRQHRIIQVDCAGVTDLCVEAITNGVKVMMDKARLIDENSARMVEPIRQSHGRWEHEFCFDRSDGEFAEYNDEDLTWAFGVLTIVLHRRTKPKRTKLGTQGVTLMAPSRRSTSPSLSTATEYGDFPFGFVQHPTPERCT